MSSKTIYYINSKNEKIVLSEWPIAVTDVTQLYGKTWTPSIKENKAKSRSALLRIYRTYRQFSFDVAIYADTEKEYQSLANNLENVIDYDVVHETAGKLYVGDWYLECFIIQTAPSEYEELFYTVNTNFTVYSAAPHWIRETSRSFFQTGTSLGDKYGDQQGTVDSEFLNFNYNFNYNYTRYGGISSVSNETVDEADFKIVIYGPISNPSIWIGEQLYQVNVDLVSGEYLVIDSRVPSVMLYESDGSSVSVYSKRNAEYNIFALIQSGQTTIQWPGTFGFDITVYERRSEPEW